MQIARAGQEDGRDRAEWNAETAKCRWTGQQGPREGARDKMEYVNKARDDLSDFSNDYPLHCCTCIDAVNMPCFRAVLQLSKPNTMDGKSAACYNTLDRLVLVLAVLNSFFLFFCTIFFEKDGHIPAM